MGEAQCLFHRLVDIAEMQQPPSDDVLNEYDRRFELLFRRVVAGDLPVVNSLGKRPEKVHVNGLHTGKYETTFRETGRMEETPRLENSHGTLAIQTCDYRVNAPPFELVQYNHHGDQLSSWDLPCCPERREVFEFVEPIPLPKEEVPLGGVMFHDYAADPSMGMEQLAVVVFQLPFGEHGDYARLSVHVKERAAGPGRFWLKNYTENAEVAALLVEKGLVVLTGREVSAGFVTLPEAYIDTRKLKDLSAAPVEAPSDT